MRRKGWVNGLTVSQKNSEFLTPTWDDLFRNDWEGKPPILYSGCSASFAFEKLQKGAKLVRRPSWEEDEFYCEMTDIYISFEDMVATDWEVWS